MGGGSSEIGEGESPNNISLFTYENSGCEPCQKLAERDGTLLPDNKYVDGRCVYQ